MVSWPYFACIRILFTKKHPTRNNEIPVPKIDEKPSQPVLYKKPVYPTIELPLRNDAANMPAPSKTPILRPPVMYELALVTFR
jgi:hypothetical protein